MTDVAILESAPWQKLEPAKRKQFDNLLLSPRVFRLTYRDDPEAFVHDCFEWGQGEGPTTYQDETLAAIPRQKRIAERGPHGLGKTSTAAWIVLWFALTRDGEARDWKLPTTASAWRQLAKYLWPEIHKWSRRLRWSRIGRGPFDARAELLTLSLKLQTGEAFALASHDPALIEGAHADSLLFLFDESKAISPSLFDAAEGAFSTGGSSHATEAFAVAISTPGEPRGRFYDIHARKPGYEDWWARHVTLEEAIAAGRISRQWAEQRKRQWGETSAVYQNRVLGEFASSDTDGVIPLSWLEAANERWREWRDSGGRLLTIETIGVDVANTGEDNTVLAPSGGHHVDDLRVHPQGDTMATVGRVKGLQDARGGIAIVDVIGMGAGVYDRLRELKRDVMAFNASARCEAKDRSNELGFVNLRSAAWWNLREELNPDYGATLALPPDDMLTGDLTAPKWWVTSGGKIQVEAKEDLRKADRLGRSTDHGDAVVQARAKHLIPVETKISSATWGR